MLNEHCSKSANPYHPTHHSTISFFPHSSHLALITLHSDHSSKPPPPLSANAATNLRHHSSKTPSSLSLSFTASGWVLGVDFMYIGVLGFLVPIMRSFLAL
ncbi:hypothetical protein AKJ16_DCAP14361 [Drosera capensis]